MRTQVQALAVRAMRAHGLTGWKFEWDQHATRYGACDHARKVVTLSYKLAIGRSPIAVCETIKHELAHALAGPTAGHGDAWRAACRVTGSTGIAFVVAR